MIGLLQRVNKARVEVAGEISGAIGRGLLVFIGVEKGDTEIEANRLLNRLLKYRVFADASGRMNLSLQQIRGDLLLVPQFTLPADTGKGTRPGFSRAALPDIGSRLFSCMVEQAGHSGLQIEAGRFGADMQVSLVNDGPVTFWLQVPPKT